MSEPAIELKSVAKSFGKHQVLCDVNLSIPEGQIFALLGRNAAGKSTMIRMLLGLLAIDHGSMSVLGLDPTSQAMEIRRKVGYLAEDQTMFGWMRVDQLIRFIAPFYETWDHELARQYVQQFDLPTKTRIRQLSKGQNVRLGLLLALAHRPKVVILDDPALGLDPIMRKQFNRDLITHLQGEGRTVFYSSHLLYEVEPIADSVAILHEGTIVRHSPTEQLREQVKRVILPWQIYETLDQPLVVLDLQRDDSEVAITIDKAPPAIAALSRANVPHRVVDLNLDEIFEAFVAGRTAPQQTPPPEKLKVEQVA